MKYVHILHKLNVDYTSTTHKGKHIFKNKTEVQGGSNMTGTDLYVNKPHCAAAVRP